MKRRDRGTECLWLALAGLCLLTAFAKRANAQAIQRESFEAKVYSIDAIGHFGVSDEKFAALTDAQKASVIEARNELIDMLQAVEHRRDVTRYVTPELVSKYKTSTALAASMIEQETSVLAAGVSDFTWVSNGTIKLKFFAVVSSEGEIVVSEKTAVLKETGSGWRFAALE